MSGSQARGLHFEQTHLAHGQQSRQHVQLPLEGSTHVVRLCRVVEPQKSLVLGAVERGQHGLKRRLHGHVHGG